MQTYVAVLTHVCLCAQVVSESSGSEAMILGANCTMAWQDNRNSVVQLNGMNGMRAMLAYFLLESTATVRPDLDGDPACAGEHALGDDMIGVRHQGGCWTLVLIIRFFILIRIELQT